MRTKYVPVPQDVFKELENQNDAFVLGKMEILVLMLEAQNINEEKTVIGSEPVFKNVFNLQEAEKIKKKLFELTDLI